MRHFMKGLLGKLARNPISASRSPSGTTVRRWPCRATGVDGSGCGDGFQLALALLDIVGELLAAISFGPWSSLVHGWFVENCAL